MKGNKDTSAEIMENVLKALGVNSFSLAKKMKLNSSSSIYNILRGDNAISSGMAQRIIKAYPNVNYEYLANNKLPVLLGEHETIAQSNIFNIPNEKVDNTLPEIGSFLSIPEKINRIEEKLDIIMKLLG